MRGTRGATEGKRLLGAAVLCLSLAAAAQASAQSNNPAATINGTVPSAEGNTWGGFDHQPTEADAPPTSAAQQAKINRKLEKLNQELLDEKLPKVPAGAPPVAGSGAQ
jgi:hypothetical protein